MKVCQIYNTLPQYREGIFCLLDNAFDTDWYHGSVPGGIKEMNCAQLHGGVYLLNNHYFCNGIIYWQTGVLKTLFKPYDIYILLGEERCISTWAFLLLKRFFVKKKVFFWSHGQYGRENRLKILIERLFWHLVDGGFLYGNYARNIMIKNGFSPEKLYVVHNSLNYEQQLRLRKNIKESDLYNKHFGNHAPVLLMIGRVNIRKRLSLLLEAVCQLQTMGESFNIIMVGDGEDRQSLEKKVEELGLCKQVWFYGACYDELTNAELIYNADMCVVPGDIGLTAIHCMMFGLPVITHNNFVTQGPEFEAIIPGKTGDFFEYNNVSSLKDVISNWFKKNESNRSLIREYCYHEVDNYWNPQFQYDVINNVLSKYNT